LRETILKSITKRAADSLLENLKLSGSVRRKEVEEARSQVMEQVFDLERRGEISLSQEEASAAA
jgi:flagellar motor switch protein FliG